MITAGQWVILLPGFNSHASGADTRIRFCLATVDPNGASTNGIVRVNANREGFDFLSDNTLLKGLSIWNPAKYLNVWTCQLNGNLYIGYAQYPIIPSFWSDSLPMVQPIPDVQPDGVVIDYRVFGDVSFLAKVAHSHPTTKDGQLPTK